MAESHQHQAIKQFFTTEVEKVFNNDFGLSDPLRIKAYLGELLARFVGSEESIAPKNRFGQPVLKLEEMIAEGDVSLRADSFERERQIHQYIGDYLLFWTGMFPEGHKVIRIGSDHLIEPTQQGRVSYEIVSLFDHAPNEELAPMFRELSENFEAYQYGLRQISRQLWAA